jgi:hypothetical protein
MKISSKLILTAFLFCVCGISLYAQAADKGKQDGSDAAVQRARREVRMLDDVYKSAVVLITENYVTEESDLPAGAAAKALFEMIKAKGWHEVQLLDATGDPINEENVPDDDFEKAALKKILDGAGYYDLVETNKGKRYLRAATPIPVVLEKCIMCHDHYADVPNGQAIGMLGYTIPLE